MTVPADCDADSLLRNSERKSLCRHQDKCMDDGLYLDLLKRCLSGYLYPESSNQEVLLPQPGLSLTQKTLVRMMNRRGYKVFRTVPFDAKARELGTDWPSIGYSMIGLKRLDNLQACMESVIEEGVPGDLLEAGVWRGGSCIFMRAVLKLHGVDNRNVWLADSFQGLPKPSLDADRDYDLSGHRVLAVSLEEVQAAFQRFGMLDGQVKFLKGWFKDTLPTAPVSRLAILRMDGDLYESSMDILNSLYHKVSPGGFVIVDDYHMFPPCKLAVDEFRGRAAITEPIREIDGTGIFWKKS